MPKPLTEEAAQKAIKEEKQAALVARWRKKIEKAKEHWEPVFERMRTDQDWVYYGTSPDWYKQGAYTVNILKRELRQSVFGLYARNPTFVASRRRKLDTVIWQGDMMELQEAVDMALAAATGQPVDPQALARAAQIITEAREIRPQLALRDRFATTLELLFDYFLDELEPNFKRQMKALVNRAKINTVGYLKLDFQRAYGSRKETGSELRDDVAVATELEMRKEKPESGDDNEQEARKLETEYAETALQEREQIIVQEGPVFDFPRSDKVIPDSQCTNIDGFIGANWIATEMDLSRDEIKRRWKFDVREHLSYEYEKPYETDSDERTLRVWEVQDKTTKMFFVICEGCDAFVSPPQKPNVDIERFWTIFPLVFGFNEHYKHAFPLSDAHDMRDTQNEYNVSREALADHRRQNKPKYLSKKGSLQDENTKMQLRDHASGEVIEINISDPGAKVTDALQAFQPYSIDMNQYSTAHVLDDFSLLGSKQEANMGLLSGATATESTIAENSRLSGQSSEVDDVDDFLSAVAKATGQVMQRELSKETVVKIVGPGAVWPEASPQEIAEGVTLDVKAGSAGRPNEAMTIQKLERAMQFVIQLPNVNPMPLVRKYAEALDVPVEELLIEGMPSISALNQQAGASAAALPTNGDPRAQGPQGRANGPAPAEAPSQTDNITPFPGDKGLT